MAQRSSGPIHDYHGVVFAGVLNDEDARRATEVIEAVLVQSASTCSAHSVAGLSRTSKLAHEAGDLDVLSVEDLLARTTAFVCGRLRRGETIDVKHAVAFNRLRGLGQTQVSAWNDHRQPEIVPNTQPTQPEVHQCVPPGDAPGAGAGRLNGRTSIADQPSSPSGA